MRVQAQYALAVGVGTFYGVGCRFFFGLGAQDSRLAGIWAMMSLVFLFAVPFAIGYITQTVAFRNLTLPPSPLLPSLLAPILPILVACLFTLIAGSEGMICIAFFLPIGMIMAIAGGLAARFFARHARKHLKHSAMAIAAFPFLLSLPESRIGLPDEVRVVDTNIVINAPVDVIWRNIERVPAITPKELPWSWSRSIGFPRPIEAALSAKQIGGVRQASFAGGVIFTETIFDWQPMQELAFTIRANTDQIPATVMDEHVTVGGKYFDVLTGKYEILPQSNGQVRLRLTSQERLSTHFNMYAGFWTDAVMRDIQNSILVVIKNRSERQAKLAS